MREEKEGEKAILISVSGVGIRGGRDNLLVEKAGGKKGGRRGLLLFSLDRERHGTLYFD